MVASLATWQPEIDTVPIQLYSWPEGYDPHDMTTTKHMIARGSCVILGIWCILDTHNFVWKGFSSPKMEPYYVDLPECLFCFTQDMKYLMRNTIVKIQQYKTRALTRELQAKRNAKAKPISWHNWPWYIYIPSSVDVRLRIILI